ncbi:hypothetical protein I3271_00105 [Photobacterium leiognathi]|uniref:toprim domain-containing protein n=1 Tax=Photobacterium leiognathi TaxID=553611 RepID=UPI001EDCBC16|nr:toprim domain-containing protein [Photobacterium leiognathi]MCG3883092.1 hypothetical protein [Photobacterium leiognathi]
MNVHRKSLEEILASDEIKNLAGVLGTGVAEDFNIEKLKYGKIIIMTDADVDGEHICTLLFTFFHLMCPNLITHGHVYLALPPLYKTQKKGSSKSQYFLNGDDINEAIPPAEQHKYDIQRFKGLGEMNPAQLKETTMCKENRTLLQLTWDLDAMDEVHKTFEVLMGEDVPPRRHAVYAEVDK